MRVVVRCECGWTTRGEEGRTVEAMQVHQRQIHRRELTREQVLAMAEQDPPGPDPGRG